ncbi:hypothetical protein AZ22_2918 [Bordetella bronchiseptica 980-2]|nr:hypothetical protein AZ22_2918 [Bordetella bronchiseptica 980-2]
MVGHDAASRQETRRRVHCHAPTVQGVRPDAKVGKKCCAVGCCYRHIDPATLRYQGSTGTSLMHTDCTAGRLAAPCAILALRGNDASLADR